MSFSRTARTAQLFGRKFSSVATQSPKLTIAKNMLRMKAISEAKTDAELEKVLSSPLADIDLDNLPTELQPQSAYFGLASMTTNNDKFVHDSTAWQNKEFSDFATEELQRAETWPFFVGIV